MSSWAPPPPPSSSHPQQQHDAAPVFGSRASAQGTAFHSASPAPVYPPQPPTQVHGYPYANQPGSSGSGAPPLYPAFGVSDHLAPQASTSPSTHLTGASGVSTSCGGSVPFASPRHRTAAAPSSGFGPLPSTLAAPTHPYTQNPPASTTATTTPASESDPQQASYAPAPPPPLMASTTHSASAYDPTTQEDVYVPAHVQLPREAGREEYADEVVQEAAKQWVDAQYRRHQQQAASGLGGDVGGAGVAGADAAYLQHDALTGATREEMEGLDSAAMGAMDPEALKRHLDAVRRREEAAAAAETVTFVVRATPKHQRRLVLLLAVTLFGTLPLLSSMAVMVLLAGIIVMYVMDFLDYPRATIFAMLATVVCFGVAVFLSNFHAAVTRLGPTLLILDLVGVLLVVVAAGLLHFHWVQETYPELICTMERTVMATAPLLAMPSFFSTSLALAGARYGPVWFFVALCVLHYTFYAPLESSFLRVRISAAEKKAAATAKTAAGGGAAKADGAHKGEPSQRRAKLEDDENPEMVDETRPQQLNGRAEALFFTLTLLVLPSLLYTALQSNWGDHIIANVFNVFGFVCGATVYLCADPARTTWFLVPPPRPTPKAGGDASEAVKAALAAEEALRRLEYDPLGLQDAIQRNRLSVLSTSCVVMAVWAAYRLVTSRHAYVFNGLPFPGNFIALLLIFYLALFVVIETMQLLELDGRGVDVRKPKYIARRALVVLAAQIAAVSMCLVSGAPPTFFLPATLSIAAFHLFLLDRTNVGPMIAFTVFSSLMLLWWLYRTFSFLVVDLHVLGEVASVPTPVLSLSVLWMYVLGCITFTLAFSPNKTVLIIFLFMYVSQLTWIEHVLYSQKEDGTYPGALVLATTAVGVFLARRLYQNEVLGVSPAAFVASCFVAKLPTFLIEVTSSYYYDEITLARARKSEQLTSGRNALYDESDTVRRFGATRMPLVMTTTTEPPVLGTPSPAAAAWDRSAKIYAVESSGGWWCALVGSYVAALFILEARRRLDVNHATRYVIIYCLCAAALSLCTVRNVQRAVYEVITQSYVDAEEVGHIGVGTACATFTLLTMPLFAYLEKKYSAARYALRASRVVGAVSVMLLLVQPTRVVEKHISFLDYEFEYADRGRWAAAVGLMMLLGGRFLAQARLPLVVRAVYWLVTGLAVAFGIVTMLLPVPTLQLFLFVWAFVFLTMLCVDLSHYRQMHALELYVVYGLSIVAILMAFFSLNRVNLERVSRGSASVMWEIHEQGRLQLLAVVMAANLFLSVLLKFRVSGRSLLPRSAPLSPDSMRGVSVIANYATMLTVCVTSVLNFYANDSEPLLYVVIAFFLLMLVDDGELFLDLRKEQFRYFPPVAFALGMLWFCAVYHAWRTAIIIPLKVQNIGLTLLCGLVTLPAQASLLRFLYLGHARGGDSVALVLVTCVLSGVMVPFGPQQSVRWMALLACGGQTWRLFAHRLGEHTGRVRRHGGRGGKGAPAPAASRGSKLI